MTTDRALKGHVTTILAGAGAGQYTLPPELLEAWKTYEGVRGLTVPEPEVLGTDTAAARIVMQVAAGKPADLLDVGREMQRSEGERHAWAHTQRALIEANEQTIGAAVHIAADMANRIIVEHLKPALAATLDETKKCVAAGGLNPARHASEKALNAADKLDVLAARRLAIFEARSKVVALTGRWSDKDGSGQFLHLATPQALANLWNPKGRWPGLDAIAPTDPVERLVWFASDAVASAEPWVPTVKEQDEAWMHMHGEQLAARERMASDAQAIAAMFPDRERPDHRIKRPA